MHISKWKEPTWKGYKPHDSNYCIWHSGNTKNYGDSEKTSGCQRLEENKGWIAGAQKIFKAVKLLYHTIIVDTCHYKFVKASRMYNIKSEP